MKQTLHYTKILGILSFLMLFAWGNMVYAAVVQDGGFTFSKNQTIGSGTYIVKGDATTSGTFTVKGNGTIVIIEGVLYLKGNLIVSDNALLIIKRHIDTSTDGNSIRVYDDGQLAVLGFTSATTQSSSKATDYSVLWIHAKGFGSTADASDLFIQGYPNFNSSTVLEKAYKALEGNASLLPIELTSFTAEQNGDKIDIAWTTNSEVNNDFFTVEYSIDGVTFKTLEIVDGAGTTSEIQEYAISADASFFTGVVYFRLKQTDFNGNYSYSDVIALTIESETEELIVYPNPAMDYVTISGNVTSAYVCDIYGKKIACSQNGNTFEVVGLSVGTYYVVVTTESGKKVLPFVKE